jgi:hypothetical protein
MTRLFQLKRYFGVTDDLHISNSILKSAIIMVYIFTGHSEGQDCGSCRTFRNGCRHEVTMF